MMPPPTTTRPPITRPTTTPPPNDQPCVIRSQKPAKTLIGCVWQFNGCIDVMYKCRRSESPCYHRFDDCCKIVMGTLPGSANDNFVNELPSPFMNMEQTTATSTTTTTTTLKPTTPSSIRRTPSLCKDLSSVHLKNHFF